MTRNSAMIVIQGRVVEAMMTLGRAEAFNMLSCLGPNCLGVCLGKLG